MQRNDASRILGVLAVVLASACVEPHATDNTGISVVDGIDAGSWENATANLAGMASECGNMAYMSARPGDAGVIAGIAHKGLWARSPTATAWTQIGQGSGSESIINRPQQFVYDPLDSKTWWESGIYNSFGVYRTDDDGATFATLGLGPGANLPNCCDSLSIDFTDPRRQAMLAGNHETGQHLFFSSDGGAKWTDIGSRLPANSGNAAYPLVLNTRTFLIGTWQAAGSGIFRSTDGGTTWTQVSTVPMRSNPLIVADGTIYWLADSNLGAVRSTDQGLTWTTIGATILTSSTGGLIELPDGRIAGLGLDTSTREGHVVVSADRGVTWKPILSILPIAATGLLYSNADAALYAWHWTCVNDGDPVATDAIQRLKFP